MEGYAAPAAPGQRAIASRIQQASVASSAQVICEINCHGIGATRSPWGSTRPRNRTYLVGAPARSTTLQGVYQTPSKLGMRIADEQGVKHGSVRRAVIITSANYNVPHLLRPRRRFEMLS